MEVRKRLMCETIGENHFPAGSCRVVSSPRRRLLGVVLVECVLITFVMTKAKVVSLWRKLADQSLGHEV